MAKIINFKSGGAVIAPWEVDQLDDDWLHAFLAVMPEMIAEHDRKIAEIRAEFFKKNAPQYRH